MNVAHLNFYKKLYRGSHVEIHIMVPP